MHLPRSENSIILPSPPGTHVVAQASAGALAHAGTCTLVHVGAHAYEAGVCSLDSTGQIWWQVGEDAQDVGGAHGTGSTASP